MRADRHKSSKDKQKSKPTPAPAKKPATPVKAGASAGRPVPPKPGAQKPGASAKAPAKAGASKDDAKSRGLAAVEALLREPLQQGKRPGATAKDPSLAKTSPLPGEGSRFDRCLQRAEKGEPGPIRLAELKLDAELVKKARAAGAVESYKKILEKNPSAQPGRPLVNIKGTSDSDLSFEVLSLHELAAAALEVGRETLQVSLVRLSDKDAAALARTNQGEAPRLAEVKALSPRDVAATNGFMELKIQDIVRTENIRHEIDGSSPEFQNLVESIRTIGLQNAPVVEVRPDDKAKEGYRLVCVSGHRRLLAMEDLGIEKVSCALKLFKSEKHRVLATLAENVNREDLHFLDKADGYGALLTHGMTANEIASLLDSDQRTIAKYLRASQWDQSVKDRIRALGSKATTRFLLNYLAAGERTTEELHAHLAKFEVLQKSDKPRRSAQREVKEKLTEFFSLTDCSHHEKALIEKALKFLGLIR